MNRFSFKSNFGWAFFVLIFATFYSAANVGTNATSSNVPADEKIARVDEKNDFSTNDDQTQSADRAGKLSAFFEVETSARQVESGVSLRQFARRAPLSTGKNRIGSGPFANFLLKTANRFAEFNDSFALHRSFWSCETVSRPLFLLLQTLRN